MLTPVWVNTPHTISKYYKAVRSITGSRERSRDHVACRSRDRGSAPVITSPTRLLDQTDLPNFFSKEGYKVHDKTTFHETTHIVSDYHIIWLKYLSNHAEKIQFI